MKLLLFIILSFVIQKDFGQCVDSLKTTTDIKVKKYLLKLNSKQFNKYTIKEFLSLDSVNKYCNYSYFSKYPSYLAGIKIFYKGYLRLNVYANGKCNITKTGGPQKWNMKDILGCKISKIEVLDMEDLK